MGSTGRTPEVARHCPPQPPMSICSQHLGITAYTSVGLSHTVRKKTLMCETKGQLEAACSPNALTAKWCSHIFLSLPKDTLSDFRERGKGGRERGRETLIGCLLCVPQSWTKPASSVCAVTGDRTRNPSVSRTMLQPTEPQQPGRAQRYFKTT